jgi:enoyl-CoA hydratase/carnithine racemase
MSCFEDLELQDLGIRREKGWLEVMIDRPAKRNALRERTAFELLAVLELAESDRELRAVLLHGAGGCFCAGVDTGSFAPDEGAPFERWRARLTSRKISRLYASLPNFTKPLIAAVDGYALGGGFELALACDLIVASKDATFGLTEVKLGMVPGGGGTAALARVVGRARAKHLIWTGLRFDGMKALELGIAIEVADPGSALEKARSLVGEIARNAPLPIMFSKALIDRSADLPARHSLLQEGDLSFALSFSEDQREGLAAFRERRPPSFKGR